ncbi:hypothetical protein OSTOST_11272 [Ostertagia ostertagi]
MSHRNYDEDSFSRLDGTDQQEDFECYKLVDEDDHDVLISRYLSQGDCETATYWIDRSYAKKCETSTSMIDFANYIKGLTIVHQYKRVSQLILNRHLVKKHIVFAYYYVNALFHLRMYSVIVQLPIGNLMLTDGLPVRYPDYHCGLEDYLDSFSAELSESDLAALNKMMTSLKLFSALMVVYGRTYILLENRDFASRCLIAAFLGPPFSSSRAIAEKLQTCSFYKQRSLLPFVTIKSSDYQRASFSVEEMKKMKQTEISGDPRQKTELARELYRDGKVAETLETTTMIMEEHGLYMDCIILHANCLCYFQDWKKLFLLAHELVFSFPDHHYSWYVVAAYYFTCNNIPAAKNFINKSALMRTAFGEAWIAYGHILAAESENEQALNCYYRAARILPWHYEPKMYIGMQYCRVGVRMAEEFLREASCIRSCDPVIMHERGSYYYRYSKFHSEMVRNALDKLAQLENDYAKRGGADTARSKKPLAEHAKSRLATRKMRQELARANTRKKIMDPVDQQ